MSIAMSTETTHEYTDYETEILSYPKLNEIKFVMQGETNHEGNHFHEKVQKATCIGLTSPTILQS